MDTNSIYPHVHHGKNIRRFRELLGVKQDVIATELHVSQQTFSKLEQKEMIGDEMLAKVAKVLNIPVDSIKNFREDTVIHLIANKFNDTFHEDSSFIKYAPTMNPLDKIVELYERILRVEQGKNALLEKLLTQKDEDLKK